jgi:hypothetical protein
MLYVSKYKPFDITIMIDDDFGVQQYSSSTTYKIRGVSDISNGLASIDPVIFKGKNFWLPIEMLFSKFSEKLSFQGITEEELYDFASEFGKFEVYDNKIIFNKDNFYDLESIYLDNDTNIGRINFQYSNSPVKSFYLMDEGTYVKIIISPFTKNYYTIRETEWNDFVNYLEAKMSVSDNRDIKISEILNETPDPNINMIRQLKFIVNHIGSYDRFLDNVYKFYTKYGYITDKQASVTRTIMW